MIVVTTQTFSIGGRRGVRTAVILLGGWCVSQSATASQERSVSRLAIREVAGVAHVGIGGDYDGTPEQPAGLQDVSCYPALFAELLRRGWSEEDCKALAGGNVLRVLRAAEDCAD